MFGKERKAVVQASESIDTYGKVLGVAVGAAVIISVIALVVAVNNKEND